MNLYTNINYITKTKLSQNKLSKLSKIPQTTISENLKNNREFKGTQIYKIATVLIELNIIKSFDELFLENIEEKENGNNK